MKKFSKNESGQALVPGMLLLAVLMYLFTGLYNFSVMCACRVRLQQTADAAAYSTALWQARGYNFVAYTMRAAIANYNCTSFITGLYTQARLWSNMSKIINILTVGSATGVCVALEAYKNGLKFLVKDSGIRENVSMMSVRILAESGRTFLRTVSLMLTERGPAKEIVQKMMPDAEVMSAAGMGGSYAAQSVNSYVRFRYQADFTELYRVYEETLDDFSKGSLFPRKIKIGVTGLELGIKGFYKSPYISKRMFLYSKDGAYGKIAGKKKSFGCKDVFGLREAAFSQLKYVQPPRNPRSYPFTVIGLVLKRDKIPYIDLPGMKLVFPRLEAKAKAEAFFDTDKKRADKKPVFDFWRPYWKVRLVE
ncbi:MAG: TadE/TadG family type IV pilus assembly protein [Fibrobacterota bacterium]